MIAGRYSLDREIGRGGAGVVWLGRDETLGRQVALKRMGLLAGDDAPSANDVTRAEREARLAAQLHHPHVVSVFDAVTEQSGDSRWLVMEYVDGPSLAQLVRDRGALPPDEAASLVRQAAEGLAAAHRAGIVHRDVKPSNILVDHAGQVKITDFGIARLAGDATITQTGMVTGSPAYLAPEVVEGHRGDEAADVWSLGATLFHLLAGRTPYEIGDNVIGGLYRIVHDEPPRLTDVGWLGPVLEGTMAKDPARRWSMAQVRDYIAAGGRVAAPVQPPGYDAPPMMGPAVASEEATQAVAGPPRERRSRAGLVVALLVALAVVLSVGAWVVLRDSGSEQQTTADAPISPSPTPTPTETAIRQPTAAGMTAFIGDYVTAVGNDPAISWKMLTPKFQRESGGFEKYDAFWDSATNGRVSDVIADPDSLTISYQVRFDDHANGPGPTVLQLSFDEKSGTYQIDGESSKGFTPAP